MTPAQLEAHRVQFEAAYAREHLLSFAEELKKYRCLNLPDYVTAKMSNAWQAYQWGIADADAQRADLPPLPDDFSESKDWKAGGYAERVQWLLDMVSAQRAVPGVQGLLALAVHTYMRLEAEVDGAWTADAKYHFKRLGPLLRMAQQDAAQPPQQSAQPVAVASDADWLYVKLMDWCRKTGRAPANENKLFAIVEELRKLLAAAQPVEATFSLGLSGAADRYFFEKGYEKGKRDAQQVEVQPVPLTDGAKEFIAYLKDCDECSIQPDTAGAFHAGWLSAHGIKPTSSEGGA